MPMTDDRWAPYGASAGAVAVVLFVLGALIFPKEPDFGAPSAEVAAYFGRDQEGIRMGVAITAAMAPFLIWFLATVASLSRGGGPGARRAGTFALAAGAVVVGLFLADLSSLAIGALRPENMIASPELAATLRDVSWLLMAAAAPLTSSVFVAFAVLALRDRVIWPRWLGWLAAATAIVYLLRTGALFSDEGVFAADGALGLWVPVGAFAAWIALASVVLALELRKSRRQAAGWWTETEPEREPGNQRTTTKEEK